MRGARVEWTGWLLLVLLAGSLADGPGSAWANSPEGEPGSSHGAVTGVVLDRDGGAPLSGVIVTVDGTRRGAVTNHRGEFTIPKLAPGAYALIIESMGFARQRREGVIVRANQTVALQTIELAPQPIPLREVVVSPGTYALMGREPSIRQTLSSEDIEIMGWAEDIARAVQRSPGTASDEYGAQFSIRGGDADEVLVLLDGMQIYKPFHQKDFGGGLLSTVDIETIEGVHLLTGGFTAEYGDRMSGVLDMRTKRPRNGRRETSLGLSLMNARAFSMGPLGDGKGSYLVSARRGYLDLLNRLMNNEFKLQPSYYDLLGKVEYRLGERHTLSVHGFMANDTYGLSENVPEPNATVNVDSVGTGYGNDYGWLTLKSAFSPDLYARTMLYGGSVTKRRDWRLFDFDPQAHLNSATIRDRGDLGLMGFRQDWDYQVTPGVLLRLGVDAKRLQGSYDYSKSIRNEFITADRQLREQVESFSTDTTITGSQVAAYLAARLQAASPLVVEAGMRYDRASYAGDDQWSPRLTAAYSLTNATVLRTGWGYYFQAQGIDELEVQFGDLRYHPAEKAEHFTLGFEHWFGNGLQLRAEGYHKRMSGLRDEYYTFRDIDEFFPEARDDLVRLSLDGATAQGFELYLKHDTGNPLSWWLSYVLSEARDVVNDIHYEGTLVKRTGSLPRAWDQRHTLNLDVNYRPNARWQFSVTGQFRSGWPNTDFTVQRVQREDGSFAYYHDRGVFRGTRVPSYQRLDARINRHFHSSSGRVSVFLHVINLYNHENVIRYDHDIAAEDAESFQAKIAPETWFGITPFLGVNWDF